MSTTCQPVNFCSPPNWKVDFPELVGATGPQGATGATGQNGIDGRDAPTETKILLYGPIQISEVFVIDAGCFTPYTVTTAYLVAKKGGAVVTFKINGNAITGLTNINVTTVRTMASASALNALSAGDVLTMEIVSVSAGTEDIAVSINIPPSA